MLRLDVSAMWFVGPGCGIVWHVTRGLPRDLLECFVDANEAVKVRRLLIFGIKFRCLALLAYQFQRCEYLGAGGHLRNNNAGLGRRRSEGKLTRARWRKQWSP